MSSLGLTLLGPRTRRVAGWCGEYHPLDVNCGPTMETKLKSKDEIEQLVQNVCHDQDL